MSDIEILSAITDLVDQIADDDLRTGIQFIIGAAGLAFTSDTLRAAGYLQEQQK